MDSKYMGMISEDKSAPANLPQGVVHKEYPKCKYLGGYELDDSARGLDESRDYDVDKLHGQMSDKGKW